MLSYPSPGWSAGFSTDSTQNMGYAVGLGALGNVNKSDHSTTYSAIGPTIYLTVNQGEAPTGLSRDTQNANAKTERFDMTEVRERQEMAQVIGDIANNSVAIALKPRLDKAEQDKKEAQHRLETDPNDAVAKAQLAQANAVIAHYGQGSDIQMAVRAVTGVLQGMAMGNAGQAVVGGLSPYVNQLIKEATTDQSTGKVNREANLMAHALLGAVEAYATGNHVVAGAAGAVSGELAAELLTKQLYHKKDPDELSEAQKQTVTALSQLASGLAGGVVGDSTSSAIGAAEIGKRAVENNYLFRHEAEELDKLTQQMQACKDSSADCRAIQKRINELYVLSNQRDDSLELSCRSGFSAKCAQELVQLTAAFKSFEGYKPDADKIDLHIQYAHTANKYAELQMQRMSNIAKKALFAVAKEEVENAAALAEITTKAIINSDETAKEQLAQIIQEIKHFVQSPIATITEQTRAELALAEQLEANGNKDAADFLRMKVYLSNELGAIGFIQGGKGLVDHALISVGKTLRKIDEIHPTKITTPLKVHCDVGGACFVAGTLVETSTGLKPIEQIQYGELVWSREEFGETYGYKPVFANSKTDNQATVEVLVQNEVGETETFVATTEHPFFVEGMGWRKASLLEKGMVLLNREGLPYLTVLDQYSTGKLETVYNIKVEDFSTYHIGYLGVWVHNANCCDFVNTYGDIEKKFIEGGWVDKTTGKVQYIDPFDGIRKDFPDDAIASVDHILPQSEFKEIPGFERLPKEVQEAFINDPMNLQPLPKELNSSKGKKVETGTEGWRMYVKEGKEISSEYRDYLKKIQREMEMKVIRELEKKGLR